MNAFDSSVISFFNAFAQKSRAFDVLMVFVFSNNLFKGGVITAMLWWAWFQVREEQESVREHVVSTIVGCLVATLVGRLLALTLPFRERPLVVSGLHFRLPFGAHIGDQSMWSSFPSDHATLFFSLAAGLFLISRTMGLLALCHAFFVISLPRIYLGVHYPTDIVSGALIGTGIGYIANLPTAMSLVARPTLRWFHKHPPSFYAFLFLATAEIVNLFEEIRGIARGLYHFLQFLIS